MLAYLLNGRLADRFYLSLVPVALVDGLEYYS